MMKNANVDRGEIFIISPLTHVRLPTYKYVHTEKNEKERLATSFDIT